MVDVFSTFYKREKKKSTLFGWEVDLSAMTMNLPFYMCRLLIFSALMLHCGISYVCSFL